MKQCPSCRTSYSDSTLRYCLADGTVLTDPAEGDATVVRNVDDLQSEKTIAMATPGRPVRVDISPAAAPTVPNAVMPTAAPTFVPPAAAPPSGNIFKVVLALIGLGILLVLIAGIGSLIYLNLPGRENAANPAGNKDTRNVPTPAPTQSKNDKDELRDQIANLEKQLNEQNKDKRGADVPLTLPNEPATTTTARVNSPGDGFLALRTVPSSEAGARIVQIPHGATVTVGGCLTTIRIGGKSGRWCRANYDGYSGWVFDAFLIY
jgi:hypothetical protein